MKFDFFNQQWQRLINRFGQKNMDAELKTLCATEVNTMSEASFKRFCDVMIGSRTPNRPPLLAEFREARLGEEKLSFQNDLAGATRFLERKSPEEMRKHLRSVLAQEFGAVESVKEALEIATIRRRLGRVDGGQEGA